MVYKILYLPTAEYIVISTKFLDDIISYQWAANSFGISLSAPRSLIEEAIFNNDIDIIVEGINIKEDTFKIPLFRTKIIAKNWLLNLIERPSCEKFNLKKEHFQFIKVL